MLRLLLMLRLACSPGIPSACFERLRWQLRGEALGRAAVLRKKGFSANKAGTGPLDTPAIPFI